MKPPFAPLAGLLALLLLGAGSSLNAQGKITIDKDYDPKKVIPVSLSGLSGEVDAALRYDLWIAGFEIVTPEKAQFHVSGSNGARLEGRLTDAATKTGVLAKAYTGDSPRQLAHAFADDIVQTVTGRKGVARTKIAYKIDSGPMSEIRVADYDGHGGVTVTRDGSLVAAPAWVPGQRSLYYTSYSLGNPDIYLHNLGTGARQVVARYSGLNTSAAVSPDGRRVAMILSKGGSPDVWVADANGQNLVQVTKTSEGESSPCWSPDGQAICYVSRASGRPALYTIPASGGQARRVITAGVANATEPDWSPDGKTIAFTSQMGGFNICTVPAAGGDAEVLATGEDPSWAPNSRTVVFARRVGEKRVLSLLDVPTKRVKDVQQISGSCSQPAWAR